MTDTLLHDFGETMTVDDAAHPDVALRRDHGASYRRHPWYPSTPELGMVLQFKYLWSTEYKVGLNEDIGSPRSGHPCMIMGLKLEPYTYPEGITKELYKVIVAPITRRGYDKDESRALPTTKEMREGLGMHAEASWLVLDEVNTFWWPARRLLSFAHGREGACVYGLADEEFFRRALRKLYEVHLDRRLMEIPRF